MPLANYTGYGYIDFNNCNPESSQEYDFRVEPLQDGKFPTIRRLRLWYRDLGTVSFVVTLYGVYENGTYDSQVGTYNGATPVVIGNMLNGSLQQIYVDFTKTMINPQVKITKANNSGILDIIRITGVGELKQLDTL